jgi:hypothetical protein
VDDELNKLKPYADQLQPLEGPQTTFKQLEDRQKALRDEHEKLIGELMVEMEHELQLQQLGSQIASQIAKSNQDILKVRFRA